MGDLGAAGRWDPPGGWEASEGADTADGRGGYALGWPSPRGGYDPDGISPVVRGWVRLGYRVARLAAGVGLRPNAVTVLGLAFSAAAAGLAGVGEGWPMVAALLVVVSAVADTADGALAAVSGRASRLGQVYDAVADRLSEACWLVAFALLGASPWLVAACGGLAWLHEYLRVKAIGAGMSEVGIGTVGERPTRTMIAAFALLFAGAGGLIGPELAVGTVTAAGAIWALLQAAALLQLFVAVHVELG